jgi:4-hydroxybenzoate polyprenyltransferase
MSLLNVTVSTMIAILYNLFVHHLTSSLFKDNDYEDKLNRSIIFLLVTGTLGVVMSKMMFDKKKDTKKKKNTQVVSNGLWLGGILLIITSLFINWHGLSDGIKMIMIGITLISLIYYSKQALEYEEDNTLDILDEEDKEDDE